MKLVWKSQEVHYRGYRIVGVKKGGGLLLRVVPTKLGLPSLRYSRFWTLRAPWVKAVDTVCGHIDEAFSSSQKENAGDFNMGLTIEPPIEELLKLHAQMIGETSRRQRRPIPLVRPTKKHPA